ncbi:MAG: hypothetical protein V1914_04385 [archaeon]
MYKRGDLTFRYLVLMILALIVLVTVLVMFTNGFDFLFEKFRWAWDAIISMKPAGL